jgi:hypothetical protein
VWLSATVASFYGRSSSGPPFDRYSAEDAVGGYIDYFCGRSIKADLSKEFINFTVYERNMTENCVLLKIVAELTQRYA